MCVDVDENLEVGEFDIAVVANDKMIHNELKSKYNFRERTAKQMLGYHNVGTDKNQDKAIIKGKPSKPSNIQNLPHKKIAVILSSIDIQSFENNENL